jgi:amidase
MSLPERFQETDPARAALLALSALEQGHAIRDGRLRSAELVAFYLERIGRLDPQVGSFVHVRGPRALAEAEAADRARARGAALGPFHGVPVAVKDLHLLRGAPVKFGSRAFRWLWSPVDDLTVKALRRAGFIVLGKTSTSELALMPVVETDLHPPTRNPWDLKRTAGGSSGGAGAAVAAGLLPLAPGSDGAGSVRIPAALNGLFGLKPTRGGIPNPHAPNDRFGMTAIGPLARGLDDAAALADVLCGRDPHGPESWLTASHRPESRRLTVGVMIEAPLGFDTDPCRANAALEVGALLGSMGHTVRPLERVVGELEEFLPIYQRLFGDVPVLSTRRLQPVTRAFRAAGRRISGPDAQGVFERLQARVLAGFEGLDLLVTPTSAIAPPPVGAFTHLGPEAQFRAVAPLGAYTAAFNLTGQPALTMPWGFDPQGLPIGVQLVGRNGDDPRLFALARTLRAQRAQA